MKQTEKLILVIFVLTCILFGIYAGGGYLTRDKEGPVITMKEETIKASIEDSDKKLLEGVVAKDKRDGDVSDSLIIESIQMKEENQCTIVCAAFDESIMYQKHPVRLSLKITPQFILAFQNHYVFQSVQPKKFYRALRLQTVWMEILQVKSN